MNAREPTLQGDVDPEQFARTALQGRKVIVDGELLAGQGRPDDFYRLGPRLLATRQRSVARWSTREPLTLAAFDLLYVDGIDPRRAPYRERRRELEALQFSGNRWCTVCFIRDRWSRVTRRCGELDLEGLVAERCSGPYRSGARTRDWIKVKTPMWREEHAHRRHEARHQSALRQT